MSRVLARADVAKKARVYAELGLTMTYTPHDDMVVVEARPRVRECVSEGRGLRDSLAVAAVVEGGVRPGVGRSHKRPRAGIMRAQS
jgi:hypothetical protein